MQNTKRKYELDPEEHGDVLEKSRERAHEMFDQFDDIYLAFSGGKDSGAVLNLVMDVYEEREETGEKIPEEIHVVHFDDEFQYPETLEFTERCMKKWPDTMHLMWVVVPMKYGLGTTTNENFWFTWDPRYKDHWVRDMPTGEKYEGDEYGRCTMIYPNEEPLKENFEMGMKHKDISPILYEYYGEGDIISLTGVRTSESMNRHSTILKHGGWITESERGDYHVGHPVYDWDDYDLWAIHEEQGWDYNKAYDKMQQLGYAPGNMRTAHPYNTMALINESAWTQKHFWPEDYPKWERRVENGMLGFEMGLDVTGPSKPEDMTWREYASALMDELPEDEQEAAKETIQRRIDRHWEHSNIPLQQEKACPHCDQDWRKQAEYLYQKVHDIILGQV